MLVVYISNRFIRVVEGENRGNSIEVKDLHVAEDTQGCVLNGILTDPEGFSQIIRKLWEENQLPKKGVNLVIDSNQFNSKVTDIPKQKLQQMLTFVSREFADTERMEDPVYGFFPMLQEAAVPEMTEQEPVQQGKKKKKSKALKLERVFATAVSRAYVMNFVKIFEDLGISVSGVEPARAAAIKLADQLECIEERSCVVQFVDDMVLLNLLFDRGNYVYASRVRLFSDPGTTDFAVEIARTVGNILQFAQAEKLPEAMERVYIAGISPEIMDVYQDSVERIDPNLHADWLDGGKDVNISGKYDEQTAFSQFALAIGGLTETDSKTNVLTQAKEDPEEAARKKARKKKILPICILAGIMALGLILSAGRLLIVNYRLNRVKAFTNDAANIAKCDEYDEAYNKVQAMGTLKKSMEALENSVTQYPCVDNSVNKTLEKCAAGLVDVTVTGYTSEDGVLSFNSSAGNTDNINKFISILNEQDIFEAVDYSGYTQDSEGKWNVNVYCTMASRREE